MQAHHYPFIDLAVHPSVRDRFAKGDAVAVLSADLGAVLWANGAAAGLFGFDNIYDALDEGLAGQAATRRQIESALSGLRRTARPQAFMMRLSSGFSRAMTPATLEDITLPDGERALLLVSSQSGKILAPGVRARQIISGFEGTGTHVAVLDRDGTVLAATSTFDEIGLAQSEISRMIADVAEDPDRLVKRMTEARNGPMPTAIGRLADDPALHLLFAVEASPVEDADEAPQDVAEPVEDDAASDATTGEAGPEPEDLARPDWQSGADDASEGAGDHSPAPVMDDDSARRTDADEAPAFDDASDAAASSEDDVASPERETDTAAADAGLETERESQAPAPRRPQFDISRIRAELNARLAKARAEEALEEQQVPPPFADARNLVSGFEADGETDADVLTEIDAGGEAGPDTTPEAGPYSDAEPDAGTASPAGEALEEPLGAAEEPEDQVPATDGDEAADAAQPEQPEATAPAGTHTEEEQTATAAREFRFDPNRKPARFVWKINRDGKFSDVSPEFAAAVGPHSADIVGRSFPDLARVFNLDPDHVITELLNRRDTWSGKTVYWPIQGTSLVTPVDLAALPTYTRDRQFDGFRGFGIVRIGETRPDPEALGLALVPGAPLRPAPETPAEDRTETGDADQAQAPSREDVPGVDDADLEIADLDRDTDDLARMDGAEGVDADDTGAAGQDQPDAEPEDPFRGERPAIRLVETPMRRDSDKIIDLETRRTRTRDGLSPGEQAAFREIGVRLTEFTAPAAGTSLTDATDTEATPDAPEDRPVFGKRQSLRGEPGQADSEGSFDGDPLDETGKTVDEPAGEADDVGAGAADRDAAIGEITALTEDRAEDAAEPREEVDTDAPAHAHAPEAGWSEPAAERSARETEGSQPADGSTEPEARSAEPASVEPQIIERVVVEPLPSAFALPARQVMQTGLDAALVDAIPAALLVHSGDALIHANAEFLDLTGYSSLTQLAARGGLDHLLDRPDDEAAPADGGMLVRRGDGTSLKVTARLRSVNWGAGQALLLALAPIPPAASLETAAVITPTEAEALAADDEPDEFAAEEPGEPGSAASAPLPEAGETDAAALKIEAQELRSILETATDGVVILDDDGTIRSMNGSACALFNYNESETQGQPFAMLFAHESQRAVMDYVSGLAEHGVSSVLNDGREVIGREAAGGFLPLFMTIGRLSGSNGYCAVLRDITQWKRTEEELRTAKRAAETANSHKSDFLARVSHEIRTPLNAIIGFSEMMVEERFGPIGSPRYLEYAHDIGNSGKHVLDIVNDLLDISKIEAGQEQMEFVAVSLNEHLAESVSLLQPMANSQRVIIRTSLSVSVPEVVADRRSIKQIALNLLSNAIRFTPSGGQIVVSTSYEPSGNVVIRIRDTGIGMNRKELEQAMKPFGQVGPGPRQRGEGTGLGLPLTKAMVEANRAQFDIVSTPSEGTLVSISFPPQRVLAD
ncbi:hypothetical protein LL06_19855 [Hoeflea sp. BAL378]|uniref:ATP-binding protein n=1 Tax=Hoeflea sp. BAL378 TaxID=1547437 RepID=UPI000513F863|nr:ATP-binding protein [Hoeflea sp. BAL378]KGF67834.1 hypothetical protein LL06_19855 [Hoeflea sp. BAL378]